mgnify:FL=1
MSIRNYFLGAFAALALLVSCDPKEDLGEPNLTLDKTSIEFDSPEAATQTFVLTSTRDWKVNSQLPEWLGVNPVSGGAEPKGTTIEVTVTANSGTDRNASVTFTIGTVQKELSVSQKGEAGSSDDLIVYHNDFDKEKAEKGDSWSKQTLDVNESWKNEKGTGIASVDYAFAAMTVRNGAGLANSSNEGNNSSVYAGSGVNNLFFAKENYFQVKNITLDASQKNYTLSFGAIRSVFQAAAGESVFDPEQFSVYISNDGSKWVELEYAFASGSAQDAKWDMASSTFTLPDNTSALYLYFTTTEASTYRIDDLDLSVASAAGTAIDFSKGTEIGGGDTPDPGPVGTPEGDGTEASPFNVAAAQAKIKTLGADVASEEFYIKGIISNVKEVSTQFGNATYHISDDGTTAGQLEVFRGYYINGEKFTSEDLIKVGDEVVILGKLINYKGNTPEVNQGNKLISINGKTGDDIKMFTVSTDAINVSADAESATFKVNGNVEWTASVTEGDFVTILYGDKGNGADDVVLQLTKNESTEAARTAKITVTTTADVPVKSYEVVLTQAKKPGEVSGGGVVDVLNLAFTGMSGTTYKDRSGKTATSPAVYAGNSAGDKQSIQLRSKSNAGIITTASGGKVRKIVVTWNEATSSTGNRQLDIYGKSEAYTATSDLYTSDKQGTLLGSIVCGTDTELEIVGDYEFVGMRSKDGAMYCTEIQVVWE